jgi:hypothetical protein
MMTSKRYIFLFLLGVLGVLITSCNKDMKEGSAEIHFNHFFKQNIFKADTSTTHVLDNGEELIFSRFQYYISNIRLKKENGEWWEEENSYHIVNARMVNPVINLSAIPEGSYTSLEYIVGVDSVRNFSGAQDGALSPSNEMFWSWNTGYIFLMSEGFCEQREGDNKIFIHHIGGFVGENSAIRKREIEFNNSLNVRDGSTPKVHLNVQVERMYQGEDAMISVAETHRVHAPGEMAAKISKNYARMFELGQIQN